jgi:hypothetical protein
MWIIGAVALLLVLSTHAIRARIRRARERDLIEEEPIEIIEEFRGDSSILTQKEVQQKLASGAPPTPWLLRHEDAEAMTTLSAYFARAIPTPTRDGRVTISQSPGHGGPQLELFVPVLSSKSPVAILARCWDSEAEDLAANLFFFGAVTGRIASIVKKLGFEPAEDAGYKDVTVFRNRRRFERQRAG